MGKFCSECGEKLNEKQAVCLKCGVLVNQKNISNEKNDKFAITGFILGFVSIIVWLLPLFGYPVAICGIVFSSKGLKSANKGKAICGLVLSIIFLVFTFINSMIGLAMWYDSIYYLH